MTKTAAIYLRLSNDDGRAGESQSIHGQRDDCTAYCNARGWEFVEFVDDGLSGSKKDVVRPGYEAMLTAMAGGDVQVVVASKQDRLTRRGDVWENLKHVSALADVEVHTVEAGDLRLDSDAGALSADIRSAFSSFEARVIGSRSRKGLETARSKGAWTNGPTFGYDKGGVINPEQAKWVRYAYDQVLNHDTPTRTIFETFRAEGVRTSRGNLFGAVSNMIFSLRLHALAGLVTYRGEVVGPGNWEAIVTPEERDRFDAAIKARATIDRGHGQRTARRYALAGVVLCGTPECDLKAMSAQNPGNGRNHYYYCDPRRGGCKMRVKGREVESLAGVIFNHFLNYETSQEAAPSGFDDSELVAVEQQLAEVRQALFRLEMRATDAKPVLAALNDRKDTLERERAASMEQIESWHSRQRATVFDSASGALGREVRRFINNVVVLPANVGYQWEMASGRTHLTPRNADGTIQVFDFSPPVVEFPNDSITSD